MIMFVFGSVVNVAADAATTPDADAGNNMKLGWLVLCLINQTHSHQVRSRE